MWVNVWYYLGSQMIALAAAFGLSLCFESPFIRLEKLWIGSLLQSVMPSQSGHAKKNGKVHEQQTVHILDEIIKRLDREEEEKQHQSTLAETKPDETWLEKEHPKEQEEEHGEEKEKEKARKHENVHSENGSQHSSASDGQSDSTGSISASDLPDHTAMSSSVETVAVAEVHTEAEPPPSYNEIEKK